MGPEDEKVEAPAGEAADASAEETPEKKVWAALAYVNDPELHMDVVCLGLIYDVKVADGHADVEMTLTSPGCPYGPQLLYAIEHAARHTEGIKDVSINLVWEPPWSPERMSEEAKLELGFDL